MITLALIGLVGGLITGVSPCVLPMLPIIFIAGGDTTATRPSRWRPAKIILGVITAFSIIALLGSTILAALGLPDDLLRWTGLVVLAIVGLGLIVPPLGHLIERPFYRLPKLTKNDGGPFLLGLGLGTLYVPCAGPVLAAITVAGATGQIGTKTVVLTIFFAIGAALPLLLFAAAGSRMAARIKAYRKRDRMFRVGSGIVLIALAVALALNVTDVIQRKVPAYTSGLESKVADSKQVQGALDPLSTSANAALSKCTPGSDKLASCGTAPAISGISRWFNTPGDRPVKLSSLRGKVVLLDFWAYSCINCQRNQPYLNAWYDAYHQAGLEIIGVQSPEFAFEKNAKNVQGAINREKIQYPVALDPDLKTWTSYRNRYWPAKYLIDEKGTVRAIKFGEGDYTQTEEHIRELLQQANPGATLPKPTSKDVKAVKAAAGITPETYLSYSRGQSYTGSPAFRIDKPTTYTLDYDQPDDTYSFGGRWTVGTQQTKAVSRSRIAINTNGATVYNVVSGKGTITVHEDGEADRTVQVNGDPNAYEVLSNGKVERHTLVLDYSPGLTVYTFSFS